MRKFSLALAACLVLAGVSHACNLVSSAVVTRVRVIQTAYVVPQVVSVAQQVCPAPAIEQLPAPTATGCVGSAAVLGGASFSSPYAVGNAVGLGGYGAFGNAFAFRGRGIRRLGGFGRFGALGLGYGGLGLGGLGLGGVGLGGAAVAVDPLTGLPVEVVEPGIGFGGFGRFGARGFGRGFGGRGIRGRGVRRVRR